MEATPSRKEKDSVKEREFLAFLKQHGFYLEEKLLMSKQDAGPDNNAMKKELHYGVRLLLTNSKREIRIAQRDKLIDLLIDQSELYLCSSFDEAEELYDKIDSCLEEATMKKNGTAKETETTLVDIPTHGGTDTLPSVSIDKGIENVVDVGTLELHKAVLKGDCSAINLGEAMGDLDECLPKKIAWLEYALRNAAFRANVSDIEEVVGYATLYMSMVKGSSIGSVIIKLHDDMFPCLATLLKDRGEAYQASFALAEGIHTMMEQHVITEQRLDRLERRLNRLPVIVFLGIMGIIIAWR